MKKILSVIICVVSIVGLCSCTKSDGLFSNVNSMIYGEVQHYFLESSHDENNEIVYSNKMNNDMAVATLLLKNEITLNLELILGKVDKSLDEIKDYYLSLEITSIDVAYNMILVYMVLDLDLTKLKDYCSDLSKDDLLGFVYDENWQQVFDEDGNPVLKENVYTNITALKCLNLLDVNPNLKTSLVNFFSNFSSIDYMDADTAAMITIALQGEAPDEYVKYLFDCISHDGFVVDFTGNANASTMSQVACALVSEGYKYDNNIVTMRLLDFKKDIGFSNYLEDEDADLLFASPQAFKALAATFVFEENGNKIILY